MATGSYRLEVVGGPYDGVRGFVWRVMGDDFPLPKSIKVGRCAGRGECGSPGCARKSHAAYWVPEHEDSPVATLTYVLQEETIEDPDEFDAGGMARYVLGGLDGVLAGEAMEEAICYG